MTGDGNGVVESVGQVRNLRNSRKDQNRKRHAPANKSARQKDRPATAGAKPSAVKLRWTQEGEKDSRGRAPQYAVGVNGYRYEMAGGDKEWKAIAKDNAANDETILAENVSYIRAYQACVQHHQGSI